MKLELTKEKVAIVGCATSKNLAPYKDETWEKWGVNNLFLSMPDVKWDKWFEIHPLSVDKNGNWQRRWGDQFRGQKINDYIIKLAQLPCPVLMQKEWAEIPNSIKYPLAEILSKYGKYFTNSISYQIALAIHLGAKEIGLWGVDMAVNTEYHHQRPSCEYFIGIARGQGIKVTIPAEADLCKTLFLYGYEEKEKNEWKKKLKAISDNLDKQINNAAQQIQIYTQKHQQSVGAKQAIMETDKIWD